MNIDPLSKKTTGTTISFLPEKFTELKYFATALIGVSLLNIFAKCGFRAIFDLLITYQKSKHIRWEISTLQERENLFERTNRAYREMRFHCQQTNLQTQQSFFRFQQRVMFIQQLQQHRVKLEGS